MNNIASQVIEMYELSITFTSQPTLPHLLMMLVLRPEHGFYIHTASFYFVFISAFFFFSFNHFVCFFFPIQRGLSLFSLAVSAFLSFSSLLLCSLSLFPRAPDIIEQCSFTQRIHPILSDLNLES